MIKGEEENKNSNILQIEENIVIEEKAHSKGKSIILYTIDKL